MATFMNPLPHVFLLGVTAALCSAHDSVTQGMEFLRAYMPEQDKPVITEER